MEMTDEEKLWCVGAIEYYHKIISEYRRLELGLPIVTKRRSSTMDTEAEEPASKASRKSTTPNTIVPTPPSKRAPTPTQPPKMTSAPRPKTVPTPSLILKTVTKRKDVEDVDDEIEGEADGTYGDSSGSCNAGNSLPCLLFYIFCKLFIILEYSCLRSIILKYSCILLITTYIFFCLLCSF
jgi:hypothetical protein